MSPELKKKMLILKGILDKSKKDPAKAKVIKSASGKGKSVGLVSPWFMTPEEIVDLISKKIPPAKGGRPGAPGKDAEVTVDLILELLNSLPEGKRLSTKLIDGLDQTLSSMWNQIGRKGYLHGGGDTVVAGTGILITPNANGTKTISVSSTGLGIIAVSGTINDVNVSFTAPSLPTVLLINGAMYQQTGGPITWTYLAGTITLSSPVGTGGNIFGLG